MMVTIFGVGSFLTIAYCSTHPENMAYFYIALFASMFMGVSQSFGEAVVLGFLKGFPPNLVGDFSAGTGMAGIFSTFSLLGMKAMKLTDA